MFDWFKKKIEPAPTMIHPPWRNGQYVTYFLDRNDGFWAAISIHVVAFEEGAWILRAFFKTRAGECAMWFISRPDSPANDMDPIPGKSETLRKVPLVQSPEEEMHENPQNTTALAMNLLMVRRWPKAAQCLNEAPRQVSYPCGIREAHLLVTTVGPNYDKHHDLNPRVMITGVACLAVNGHENPMTATSYGCMDPNDAMGDIFEDFIDFGHAKPTVHVEFTLTYPATWFLLPSKTEVGSNEINYRAQLGGVTCAGSLTVNLFRGSKEQLEAKRAELIARIGGTGPGPVGQLRPRKNAPIKLEGNAWSVVSDMSNPGIDGLICAGLFMSPTGDCLALVNGFGCIAKKNPRCAETLVEMERAFRQVVESFQFA
jgi:hypothetical protein